MTPPHVAPKRKKADSTLQASLVGVGVPEKKESATLEKSTGKNLREYSPVNGLGFVKRCVFVCFYIFNLILTDTSQNLQNALFHFYP